MSKEHKILFSKYLKSSFFFLTKLTFTSFTTQKKKTKPTCNERYDINNYIFLLKKILKK